MATAANGRVAQPHPIHVFDELEFGQVTRCELCKEQPAAYHWIKQREGKIPQKHDLVVCRICAAMILLIGNDE